MMELAGYLDRIGVSERPTRTREWLARVHRAHLAAIPYENLDVTLGRPVSLDSAAAYAKLVEGGRGGWCYEMNGLLAWALREAGFTVDYLAATVRRHVSDESVPGNHLALRVDAEGPLLADVGFGDGLIDPVPLTAGTFRQGRYDFGLGREGERWVFRNHPGGGAPAFDFSPDPVPKSWFSTPSTTLQTSPRSPFRNITICQRLVGDRYLTLRGALLQWSGDPDQRIVASAAEFVEVLATRFGLTDPAFEALWPWVWERHLAWQARDRG